MINITDIQYGWATLHLGYCSFDGSYLTDIRADLDELFNFKDNLNDCEVHKIIIEGEGQGDLSLVAHLTFDDVNKYLRERDKRGEENTYDYVINILWQRLYSPEEESFCLLKFPYKEFLEEWEALKENIKETYERDFLMNIEHN